MSNQLSGQTGPSPQCHRNHEKHDHYARQTNHSDQFPAYLGAQALRLLGSDTPTNRQTIFAKVEKYGANRVTGAANISALP